MILIASCRAGELPPRDFHSLWETLYNYVSVIHSRKFIVRIVLPDKESLKGITGSILSVTHWMQLKKVQTANLWNAMGGDVEIVYGREQDHWKNGG